MSVATTAQDHNDYARQHADDDQHASRPDRSVDLERAEKPMTKEEREIARHAARYGYGPLAHLKNELPAFGGEFQPGTYKSVEGRKFANPAPLGLCGFALTTFVLSLINVGARGLTVPSIIIGPAFGYGGLVQLLAGMWEMAVGNTFGATALSSYGGFWIAFAIILTPGGFDIESTITTEGPGPKAFTDSLGFFLMGWFVFTTLLMLCTLKSTVAFFSLFFTLDLTFLFLALAYLYPSTPGTPRPALQKIGGAFGIATSFCAWYSAFAGIADSSNSFFVVPVLHFPWSEKGIQRRKESKSE